MKRVQVSSLVVAFLVAASAFAQSRRVDESIRLRNWKPSEKQMRSFIAAATSASLHFVTATPCRVVDTREPDGPFGGPVMASGETRSFDLNDGSCGLPANVAAYSLNFTVADPTAQGNLRAWPTGQTKPGVSTLNYRTGINLANAAIVGAGTGGSIDVAVVSQTNVVIDINGYFIASSDASAVRVTPDNLGVWEVFEQLCTLAFVHSFTNGEDVTPPLGTGSFQVTGTDGDGGALATGAYNGLLMSQLTTLRYSGKSQDATDHPFIYINLDDDSTGSPGTVYFFPANNSAQGPSRANVWQSWNGITGRWNIGGDTGEVGSVPFSTFAASHILGVRFASGCGGTTGGVPRVRNTDAVEIGFDGNPPTVFDFEHH